MAARFKVAPDGPATLDSTEGVVFMSIAGMSRAKKYFLKAAALVSFVAVLWASRLPAQETNGAQTLADLRLRLAKHLAEPRFDGALWGVKIVSLDTGRTLFEHHADRLMSPASNSKMYTGALALDQLGGDYRFATPVYATVKVSRSGTLHGDLIVVGQGDPTWNDRHLGTNFWTIFDPFVSVLTNAGVHRVTGDLIADASFFRGPPFGSGWTAEDLQESEAGETSALTLDDNITQISVTPGAKIGDPCQFQSLQPATGLVFNNLTVTVTNGGAGYVRTFHPEEKKVIYLLGQLPLGSPEVILDVSVPRPADWFAAALKEDLKRNGILVAGKTRSILWPQTSHWKSAHTVKLGEVLSPPLREVIPIFMKPSQNLENDLLFEHVGELTRGSNSPPWETSEELAVAALDQFLEKVGAPTNAVRFDEGSGLSRNNLTTAEASVDLLQFEARQTNRDDFINSLPVAGVDGTLRRRMKNTPAAGNVRAKTGTLRWVNSLSGYVTTAAGEHLAFSIMLNRYIAPPGRDNRSELDAIAVMLAEFTGRSSEDAASLEELYAPYGQLIVKSFATAPFPHPARMGGHERQGVFYSAAEHYSNSTVAIFIPKGFRPAGKIDFVVHFHGWNNSVSGTLEQYKLIEQLTASGKNALLVVPEGPLNAPDSFGGKLEDTNGFSNFVNEAMTTLRNSGVIPATDCVPGNIILSGHSGGYHVMSAILNHGGLSGSIKEVWLFDALYGGTEDFLAWQKAGQGRLLDIYTDHGGTVDETQNAISNIRADGFACLAKESSAVTLPELQTNRLVFLHSNLEHNDVVAKEQTFQQFLNTSCLTDR